MLCGGNIPPKEIILPTESIKKSITSSDEKLLASFFLEMNKLQKNVSAYPEHHPLINRSKERVLSLFELALASRNQIRIIVSRESLFIDHTCLDPGNPILRTFADSLFRLGVAAITFNKGLNEKDLQFFYNLMCLNCESIRQEGGLEKVFADSGSCHLNLEIVDYGIFCSIEEDQQKTLENDVTAIPAADLWSLFVDVMLNGIPDGSSVPRAIAGICEPENLATALNRHSFGSVADLEEVFGEGVTFLMTHNESSEPESVPVDVINQLVTFLLALKPEMRRQFVLNICNSAIEHGPVASKILESLPTEIIDEFLTAISSGELIIPPTIAKLLHKLSDIFPSPDDESEEETQSDITKENLNSFHIIFRENNSDQFVPAEYREKLGTIINNKIISYKSLLDIDAMKDTLSGHFIEKSTSLLISELLFSLPVSSRTEQLLADLLELCAYLLEIGDFITLADIYGRLESQNACSTSGASTASRKIYDFFIDAAFMKKVLEGVAFWGKTKYEEISVLIGKIGVPFIEPLLNSLADEPNISIRRFFMDCLQKMGGAARDSAIGRLDDSRWYFVRNLLVLLCSLNDSSVMPAIRKLLKHPHPKVRYEVLRTLIHFNDSEASQLLLQDMDSNDREVRLNAIKLAEKSNSPEILYKLLDFLNKFGLIHYDLDIKVAAVRSLAEIGNPDALPALAQLLRSRSFFHRRKHHRLKEEIVHSLSRYPLSTELKTELEMALSSNHALARLAKETFNRLQGKNG